MLLTWFDRNGKQGAALGEPANIIGFQFAPDRKSLAAAIQDPSNTDIWIYDVSRGLRTRFTFDPAIDNNPVWSGIWERMAACIVCYLPQGKLK